MKSTKNASPPEIGAFEAKNTLGRLLDRAERGEEIVITRHGTPVARLVPNDWHSNRDQAQAAFDQLRKRARQLARENPESEPFDWEEMKKLRDEGRP
ncbi:MAG: type II toxin-antitoxin system prevent-host-death family antitoxin [Candidatus Sulfotelmatobacter sp.]